MLAGVLPQTPLEVLSGLLLRGGRGKEKKQDGKGREGTKGDTPDFYLVAGRLPTGGFAPEPHWVTFIRSPCGL